MRRRDNIAALEALKSRLEMLEAKIESMSRAEHNTRLISVVIYVLARVGCFLLKTAHAAL